MKITAIDTLIVDAPVRPDVMINSALGVHARTRVALVRLRSEDPQLFGIGEATVTPRWSGETADGARALIQQYLAPAVVGRELDDIAGSLKAMDQVVWANPFARSAIEMAQLDALGKLRGEPVYRLLGGPVREAAIPIRFSIGALPPDEAASRARARVAWGHRTIKVKVGLDPAADLERVRAVREAIGPDLTLTVDANGGWSEEDAIRTLRSMAPCDIAAAEQPVRREDLDGMARVRAAVPVPVMADEAVFTPWDAAQALAKGACDIISIYPGKNGGISVSCEIAAMAREAGVACAIGSNLELEPGTAAMCHLARASAGVAAEEYHGDILGPLYHDLCLTRAPIRFEAGHVFCPEGPGLGIDVDWDRLAELPGAS